MFIAHLPAGYIAAYYSQDCCQPHDRKFVFWGWLVGSILPDVDMLYFYLIDREATHHHLYWTHLPIFWLALCFTGMAIGVVWGSRPLTVFVTALFAGTFLHLALDTPLGGVAWLYPFSAHLYYWVTIPATWNWWVWNFVFHWTFLFEVAICAWAIWLLVRRRHRRLSPHHDR